jgi:hypothetical protein
MAKIHIILEDVDGGIKLSAESADPMPENMDDGTNAQHAASLVLELASQVLGGLSEIAHERVARKVQKN